LQKKAVATMVSNDGHSVTVGREKGSGEMTTYHLMQEDRCFEYTSKWARSESRSRIRI